MTKKRASGGALRKTFSGTSGTVSSGGYTGTSGTASGGVFSKTFFGVCVFLSCSPLLLLLILTFSTFWPYPALFPEAASTQYYTHVLTDIRTLYALITTVVLGMLTALFSLIVAVPASKALAHRNFAGKGIVRTLVLIPLIVPGIAVTAGIHISMIRIGLTGTFVGVALMHTLFAVPYSIRILTNMFEIIGESLEQQATVLGAGKVFVFLRVTLPRIMPGILAAGMLCFTVSVAQYITTFIIGGGRVITLTILLVPHIRGMETHIAAVYSVLLIAISLLSLMLMESVVRSYYNLKGIYQI
jgi:putative spermidine/putrescine transport system permease protein